MEIGARCTMGRPAADVAGWRQRDCGRMRGDRCGVAFIALVSPPNTPDAMLYHMPRVVYWLEHHNVSLYPTIYPPQAFMPPWSEYALTHLFALAEGDRFVNLVQWFSLVGCGLGVSLVARSLGAAPLGQVFAAAAAMTIPRASCRPPGRKTIMWRHFGWSAAHTFL